LIEQINNRDNENKVRRDVHLLDHRESWLLNTICLVVVQSDYWRVVKVVPLDWILLTWLIVSIHNIAVADMACLVLKSVPQIFEIFSDVGPNILNGFLSSLFLHTIHFLISI